MHTKDCTARVKSTGAEDSSLGDGQFTAIVAAYNEDSVGDVIIPGAFKDDLDRWEKSGDNLPVVWSHDWSDPYSHIGHVLKAVETPDGLLVTGQLDLENPKAVQVYRLLKGRRVTQFSFAYDIEDAGWGERDGHEVLELRKLKLHEVGPTLVGANQETELLAVKARNLAAGAKAGRVLSQKNYDLLVTARDSLSSVLEAAVPSEDESKTSTPSGVEKTDEPSQEPSAPATDEEHSGAKSGAESQVAARRALAVARITTL